MNSDFFLVRHWRVRGEQWRLSTDLHQHAGRTHMYLFWWSATFFSLYQTSNIIEYLIVSLQLNVLTSQNCCPSTGFHLQGDNSTCQSAVDDKQSSTRVSSLHGPSSMSSGVSVAAATASASRITSNQNKEKHRPNISAASSDRTNTKNPNITIDSSAEDNKSLNIVSNDSQYNQSIHSRVFGGL